MQYRLRTLLILLAVLPPVIWLAWLIVQNPAMAIQIAVITVFAAVPLAAMTLLMGAVIWSVESIARQLMLLFNRRK